MKSLQFLLLFAVIFPLQVFAGCKDQCPPTFKEAPENWKGAMRVHAIKNIDQFLYWTFGKQPWSFPLASPIQRQQVEMDIPEVREFVTKYGYFSATRPLVAKVTSEEIDLELTCCLLKTLYEKGARGEYLNIAVAEVLTKVLAYRDLKVGQRIHIPLEREGRVSLEPFIVDEVIDIWGGMPAFGLIPENSAVASILLFRGTEFSLFTQRGWASIMSDLDIAGPGLFAFKQARAKISEWLKRAAALGKRARTMGASLGGALAGYTFIYENALLSHEGSIAVCAPGVAGEVIEQWALLSAKRQQGLIGYVNVGDIVSKVGKLFGTVYCLSSGILLKPLAAHTFLMCSQPVFTRALVAN
jgi:hypothetical protein